MQILRLFLGIVTFSSSAITKKYLCPLIYDIFKSTNSSNRPTQTFHEDLLSLIINNFLTDINWLLIRSTNKPFLGTIVIL